uniref:KH domain-containing RNA-binding protein QKI-like isoform X2 n=1 Tax=Myxine glutinosa TaxID=7769 RepID=UPI00358FF9C2
MSSVEEPGVRIAAGGNGNVDRERPAMGPEYLMQLLRDKRVLAALPSLGGAFSHLERLLDQEITRVRRTMYQDTLSVGTGIGNCEMALPDAQGPGVSLQEKLFVPVKEFPDFNFVGRILGPRGLTAKQLETETGCKIMVRGRGSMRDKKKEEQNRGKPNWEHLNEDLHVLVSVEDTRNRADIRLARAVAEVRQLLVPSGEGEDMLKKMQLMELAILNGTYRDGSRPAPHMTIPLSVGPRLMATPPTMAPPLHAPHPALAHQAVSAAGLLAAAPLRPGTPAAHPSAGLCFPIVRPITAGPPPPQPPLGHFVSAAAPDGSLIYTYDYPYTFAPAPQFIEYSMDPSAQIHGAVSSKRRHDARMHPYQRLVTSDRNPTI